MTELSVHTNAKAMHALSSVMAREREEEGESKKATKENLHSKKNKYIGKKLNCVIQEKNKVKHNFQVHKGLL